MTTCPFGAARIPAQPPYAALVDFYGSSYRDQPVRMAVLLQPVASATGRSMAVIQVAETLQLRHNLACEPADRDPGRTPCCWACWC